MGACNSISHTKRPNTEPSKTNHTEQSVKRGQDRISNQTIYDGTIKIFIKILKNIIHLEKI